MNDKADQTGHQSWKTLQRIPENLLRHPHREGNGTVYGALLLELQIRSEHHAAFFEGNIRPFRNKKESSTLLAKGDKDSLLKLSKTYMKAYGKITWGQDRRWLLEMDELKQGDDSLQYVPPRVRQDGEHDRFHGVLARLWTQMRGIIFEVKSYAQQKRASTDFGLIPTNRQDRHSPFSPPSNAFVPSDQSRRYDGPTQISEADWSSSASTVYDPTVDPSRPLLTGTFGGSINLPPRYWPASKTEEVILNAMTSLIHAQQESQPEVFKTLWRRHLARLEELEQFSEQQLRIETKREIVASRDQRENTQSDGIECAGDLNGDKTNETDMISAVESKLTNGDIVMTDCPTDPIQGRPRSSPKSTSPHTTDTTTTTTLQTSHSDAHRQPLPPTFSLPTYLPPTIPNRMTVYITPFATTTIHPSQPYIWPDAPVHETSYIAFRNGIRLRANVPDSVTNEKLWMVFGYGWDDLCCVMKGEESWRGWFIRDLRRAASRGSVGVWRMRVCVVGGGGGGGIVAG